MSTRRAFLGLVGGVPLAAAFRDDAVPRVQGAGRAAAGADAQSLAADEDFWCEIQQAFTVDRSMHQPEQRRRLPVAARRAGGDAALPRPLERGARLHHVAAARAADRVGARARSRASFGCDPEEMAITRNASESLEICSSAST